MTIYKYELEIRDLQVLKIPYGYKIISIQQQDDNICMWVIVDPACKDVQVIIRCFGTGHNLEPSFSLEYLGTVVLTNPGIESEVISSSVWHFFEQN